MKPKIEAGDKIIVFYSSVDIRQAVAYEGPLGTVYQLDGIPWIYFSSDEEEAKDHRYGSIRLSHVQAYSDELWAACEALDREHAVLSARFTQLKAGKVPEPPAATLFDLLTVR